MSFLFTVAVALNDILFSFSYSLFDFRFPHMHKKQLRNNAWMANFTPDTVCHHA